MVETGFSYLRKNLRRTIMRVRENLGLRSEPLLPRLRTICEPHEREAEEVEKVEVYEREAEKPVEEVEGVEPQEVRTKEAREPSLRGRTLIEDIIAYRREHGIMASLRRILEASARQAEIEAARAQAQAQDQEAKAREEALRKEVERLRQELKRLQGAHY